MPFLRQRQLTREKFQSLRLCMAALKRTQRSSCADMAKRFAIKTNSRDAQVRERCAAECQRDVVACSPSFAQELGKTSNECGSSRVSEAR